MSFCNMKYFFFDLCKIKTIEKIERWPKKLQIIERRRSKLHWIIIEGTKLLSRDSNYQKSTVMGNNTDHFHETLERRLKWKHCLQWSHLPSIKNEKFVAKTIFIQQFCTTKIIKKSKNFRIFYLFLLTKNVLLLGMHVTLAFTYKTFRNAQMQCFLSHLLIQRLHKS